MRRTALILGAAFAFGAPMPAAAVGSGNLYEQYRAAGVTAWEKDNCNEAKKQFSLAATEAEKFGKGDARLVIALNKLGRVHDNLDELAEAEAVYKRAFDTVIALKGRNPTEVGTFWRSYARLMGREKKFSQAAEVAETAIAALERGHDNVQLGLAYNDLGNYYDALGRESEAEALRKRAVATLKKTGDQTSLAVACTNLALSYSRQRRLNLAWKAYDCALDAAEKSGGLVRRTHKTLFESYSGDLKTAGRIDRAAEADLTLAKINDLPPEEAGKCRSGLTVTAH